MDLSLRDLIDGMLQKSPTSRYDWHQINDHPFVKVKTPLNEIYSETNQNETEKKGDEFEEEFLMNEKNFRSSALLNNKDRVEIAELKQYE